MRRGVQSAIEWAGNAAVVAAILLALPVAAQISNPFGSSDTVHFLGSALESFVSLLIPVIVLCYVVVGLLFVAARGNAERLVLAKKALLYLSISAVVVLGSWSILQVVGGTINTVAESGVRQTSGNPGNPPPSPPAAYSLSVVNSGNGTVTSDPSGIDCGSACLVSGISAGASYVLMASPDNGYTASWSGCSSSSGGSCSVTVNADTAVSVSFVAVQSRDTQAPSIPDNLAATAVSSSQINLLWSASSDNIAVAGYYVYRNGREIGASVTDSYRDTGLDASTNYTYTVSAFDAAGNVSAQASSVSVTTRSGAQQSGYTITASAGAGGSISPSGTITVSAGSSQSFAITPSIGFRISSMAVDGSNVGAGPSYSFPNVTGDHTISVSFSPAAQCTGRTFYIDYANGSDSNCGNSISSPWKRAPGMQGFSGSYSHQAGDRFIFKGGVTWPNSVFTWNITNGGTANDYDYYGVDKSWYAGASWTRPIMNSQGKQISTGQGDVEMKLTAPYVTIDDFEFTGHYWDWTNWQWNNNSTILSYAGYLTVEDCYFHGWSHATPYFKGYLDSYYLVMGDNMLKDNVVDGSDTTNGGDSGNAFQGGGVAVGNVVSHIPNAFVSGFQDIHGNTISYITKSFDSGDGSKTPPSNIPASSYCSSANNCIDWGNHNNAIEAWCGSRSGGCKIYIHDNVIHDTDSGAFSGIAMKSVFGISGANAAPTYDYVYNNVIWNVGWGGGMGIAIDTDGPTSLGHVYIFNNTIHATDGAIGCMRLLNRGTGPLNTLYLANNFCMGGSDNLLSVDNGQAVTNYTTKNNVMIPTATAASQGYSIANAFAPTASSDSSVDAGTDLSSLCPSCTGATTDLNGVSRPQGSAWDVGAYEYGGSSASTVLPSAAAILLLPQRAPAALYSSFGAQWPQ